MTEEDEVAIITEAGDEKDVERKEESVIEVVEEEASESEESDDEEEEYKLVGSSEASSLQNKVSNESPFGKALIELAKENDKIVGLSADLAKYTDIHVFRDEFPDRFTTWACPSS